jgi:hypothetical protein
LILQHLNLSSVAPTTTDVLFSNWWRKAVRGVPKEMRKGLNYPIVLVSWESWKHLILVCLKEPCLVSIHSCKS